MVAFVSKRRFVNSISKGNCAILRGMLSARPQYANLDLKWEKTWSGTVLHCACYYNQPEVIKLFVEEEHLDVNKKDKDLGTALHDACRRNAYESAEMLIKLGADVTIENAKGEAAHDLCKTNKMMRLVREAVNVREEEYREKKERNSLEHEIKKFIKAISVSDIDALKAILNRNPEMPNTKIIWANNWNGTPLHCASYYNQPDVIRFFVEEKHLDVNKRDSALGTALHDACSRNAYESAEMLINLGADATIENAEGCDALSSCTHNKIKSLINKALEKRPLKNKIAIKVNEQKDHEDWKTRGSYEIIHEYNLPDSDYKITDIFNFKARYWRSITQDMASDTLAQETKFFDEIPDKEILHEARENFNRKFGGKILSNVVDSIQLRGKPKIK